MKKEVGLWLDHKQAVIVINLDQEEEIKRITSNIEQHVHYSGASRAGDANVKHDDTTADERLNEQLGHYYDEIIIYLQDATSILIMGTGEAKFELQKRFEGQESSGCIVAMKTANRMTDQQIVTKVHQHFRQTQSAASVTLQPAQ